jgi:hypothetical protein
MPGLGGKWFEVTIQTHTFAKNYHMSAELSNPQDLTIAQFLALFSRFSRTEQEQIARTIWEKTFAAQWRLLDKDLPNLDISEEEILEELRAVRYGKTAKN